MSRKSCCCGRRVLFEDEDGITINDYKHELPGEGKFCGPGINHRIRDLENEVFSLRKIKDAYDEALAASNEAGYAYMTPAQVIRDQASIICENELPFEECIE